MTKSINKLATGDYIRLAGAVVRVQTVERVRSTLRIIVETSAGVTFVIPVPDHSTKAIEVVSERQNFLFTQLY